MGKFLGADLPGLVIGHKFEAGASSATNGAVDVGYFVAPADIRVLSAHLVFEAAVTGQGTNFKTYSLVNLGTNGAGTKVIAQLAFSSTAVTAGSCAPVAMPVTAANAKVSAGEVLVLKQTNTGSGQAHPKFNGSMAYEFQ